MHTAKANKKGCNQNGDENQPPTPVKPTVKLQDEKDNEQYSKEQVQYFLSGPNLNSVCSSKLWAIVRWNDGVRLGDDIFLLLRKLSTWLAHYRCLQFFHGYYLHSCNRNLHIQRHSLQNVDWNEKDGPLPINNVLQAKGDQNLKNNEEEESRKGHVPSFHRERIDPLLFGDALGSGDRSHHYDPDVIEEDKRIPEPNRNEHGKPVGLWAQDTIGGEADENGLDEDADCNRNKDCENLGAVEEATGRKVVRQFGWVHRERFLHPLQSLGAQCIKRFALMRVRQYFVRMLHIGKALLVGGRHLLPSLSELVRVMLERLFLVRPLDLLRRCIGLDAQEAVVVLGLGSAGGVRIRAEEGIAATKEEGKVVSGHLSLFPRQDNSST
mmetsp:Transcript_12900/g.30682  ORF Transcript_12900/g.30682 Transcript_12900/m.30682 type:complete len:381 (-) Transcript_12900:22-1164(-)